MSMRNKRPIRGIWRDKSGVASIEFAILALPFLLTIFAVVETALSYTAQQVLSNAVAKISREIRTGVLDPDTLSRVQFEQRVCSELRVVLPGGCPNLHVDVSEYATFSAVPKNVPYTYGGSVDSSGFRYNPGDPGTINNMRVIYEWPVITDIMKSRLSNLANGRILLYASATWRNEP